MADDQPADIPTIIEPVSDDTTGQGAPEEGEVPSATAETTISVEITDSEKGENVTEADNAVVQDEGKQDDNGTEKGPEGSETAGEGDDGTKEDGEKTSGTKDDGTGEESHKVTMTITIAMAIPTVEDEGPTIEEMLQKKKRLLEAPKAQYYFHLEYYLLPDDPEPQKVDLVTFGMAAKIYTEHDSKVVKTWMEGELTWVAWTHRHELKLRIWDSKDKVSPRARFDRPKAFRLPGGGDELAGVKSLVLKQSQSFMDMQPLKTRQGIRSEVSKQRDQYSKNQQGEAGQSGKSGQQKSPDKQVPDEASPEKGRSPSKEPQALSPAQGKSPSPRVKAPSPQGKAPASPVDEEEVSQEGIRTYDRLSQLAGVSPTREVESRGKKGSKEATPSSYHVPMARRVSEQEIADHGGVQRANQRVEKEIKKGDSSPVAATSTREPSRQLSEFGKLRHPLPTEEEGGKKKTRKKDSSAAAAMENIKKFGAAVIPLSMKILFAGKQSITNRLDKPGPFIQDVYVTVALDGALMSEKHLRELNPLIIKVAHASNMPATPLNYQLLKDKCEPTYISYKFLDQDVHRSIGREQDSNVYWDDLNVILTGTLDPGELREFLIGPPLEVEVHDRDRLDSTLKKPPTIFGDDMEDDKIHNVGMITARRTTHNPLKEREKVWDPYGVAKFDMSDLLLGQKSMNLTAPIHCCPLPDMAGIRTENGKLVGIIGAVDGPEAAPLPTGHYLETNAQLKIRLEVAYPLRHLAPARLKNKVQTPPEKVESAETASDGGKPEEPVDVKPPQCPFARIIFMFPYHDKEFLHRLQAEVTAINAAALQLDQMPQHVIEAALSTYKLSVEQQKSKSLDIVTGFQVLDGELHVFVLEGLRDKAIHRIWSALPRPEVADDVFFKVLYNSEMTFRRRLYAELDVDLCRVRLHEPISVIVQQPLLYVRDMVPKPCFDSLARIDKMLQSTKLRDVTRNDLFPTAEMVVSMSKEFGIPLTMEDFEDLKKPDSEEQPSDEFTASPMDMRRPWTPLDMYNYEYEEFVKQREMLGPLRDYVRENIDLVDQLARIPKHKKEKTIAAMPVHGRVHNYSTQALNSTELAKELLRQELAKEPDARFTLCQDYHHSMTVDPVDLEAVRKQQATESRDMWRTKEGFIYPGMKTTLECNVHPHKPGEARVDDLRKPWREGLLHAAQLKPTLPRRERYSWDERTSDLDLWKRPPLHFGSSAPITIHLPGKLREEEIMDAAMKDYEDWRSKIVPNDTQMHFHRINKDTELKQRGKRSGNQLDRLRGLLKDDPRKLALSKSGFSLKEIPPLSVVNYPSVDRDSREAGKTLLPAVENEGEERGPGFTPGPHTAHSWLLEKNKIPVRDMEHDRFISTRGGDFNVYHKDRSVLHSRSIPPLHPVERDNNLFKTPPKARVPSPPTKDRHFTPDDKTGRNFYKIFPGPAALKNLRSEMVME
ncbi:KIAA1257 [Branchiostoma lanceolatum]|uniref:KIAA1257 protein n=1 Tax=Branchiostoma lanceolatum TaxID=7740 RepID=A0A8K0EX51_BRALA|nr:KIAA1257 [Branchiostoma lanceolatum]